MSASGPTLYARQSCLPVVEIERGDPAAHAHLAAARADDDFVLHDDRRHRDRLAAIHVAHLHPPQLRARRRVDRDRVTVEQVVDDLPVRVRRAAIHDVAARDANRRLRILRAVLPLERKARLREIQRVRHVRIRRDDVHRVVDDERLAFVSAQHAGGDGPCDLQILRIRRGDVTQLGVSRVRVIAAGHGPASGLPDARDRDARVRSVGDGRRARRGCG